MSLCGCLGPDEGGNSDLLYFLNLNPRSEILLLLLFCEALGGGFYDEKCSKSLIED